LGKRGEAINEDPSILLSSLHPKDREFVEINYRKFLGKQKRKSLEFRIQGPDESVKWISLSAFKILQGGQQHSIAGFAEDITDRKHRESTSLKFNAKKNAVMEILSHEIKGSIGMIQAINSQVGAEAKAGGNGQVQEYAQVIERICKHNLHLIRSLLNSEFLETSDIPIVRTRLDLVPGGNPGKPARGVPELPEGLKKELPFYLSGAGWDIRAGGRGAVRAGV
jgi:two-component system sensor histidine kinase VicK